MVTQSEAHPPLCGDCRATLKRRGFLHIDERVFMLRDGSLVRMTGKQVEEFFNGHRDIERFIKEQGIERIK
jgi:hypothetical protein